MVAEPFLKIKEIISDVIIYSYRGSIAHGMYISEISDDIDYVAICIPKLDCYFGLEEFGSRGTIEIKEGADDIVIYELKKTISMLKNGNPNIITLLWNDIRHFLKVSEEGRHLIRNRNIFSNKNIYNTFCGYAQGQFKKMTDRTFQGYMGAKRKELFLKFGYDTKNAAHLIRLLRMCKEFLTTGEFQVLRNDAQNLLEIKQGAWSLEQVKRESDKLFIECEEAYIASKLPERTDPKAANKLCMEIMEMKFLP